MTIINSTNQGHAIGIRTYSPQEMDNKIQPLNSCTITSKNEGDEKDYTLVHHTTKDHHSIRIETNQHYYVDMFLSPTMIKERLEKFNVVKLDDHFSSDQLQ